MSMVIFDYEGDTLRVRSHGANSGVQKAGKLGYVKWSLSHLDRGVGLWKEDSYVLLPVEGTLKEAVERLGFTVTETINTNGYADWDIR
jgi:hypothetical protein